MGVTPEPTAREVLKPLVLPIYAPTLLQAIGATAVMPLIPLMALALGFSVPAAAALALIGGVVGVLGPIPVSRLMGVVGEKVSMVACGFGLVGAALAGFVVVGDAIDHGPEAWHRLAFLGILLANALFEQAWMLGRQSYMGTQLPVGVRARGMSTLGGMMRIGQVLGPVAGAVVVTLGHEGWVFVFEALLVSVATALVAFGMLPGDATTRASVRSLGRSPIPPDPSPHAPGRPALRTMLLAGIGVIPLTMSRVNRPLLLPLLGAALGLDAPTISLIFGAAAAVEIVMFVPAGTLMDRRGRAAVAVPCVVVSGLGYVAMAGLGHCVDTSSRTAAIVALGLSALLIAFGNGLGAGIVMTLGIDLSPERLRTRHLARWNAIGSVGRLTGPGLVSLVTLFGPLTLAALATGVIAVAAGAWLAAFLPGVTPRPRA